MKIWLAYGMYSPELSETCFNRLHRDLADLDNNGQLTREGFAVAMHLIQKRIAGQELPEVLPPSLVPPSMRNGSIHATTQQRSPEPVTDLFSFDETPAVPSQPTGSITTLQPQQTGPKLPAFAPPAIPSRAATIDPFSSSTKTQLFVYVDNAYSSILL